MNPQFPLYIPRLIYLTCLKCFSLESTRKLWRRIEINIDGEVLSEAQKFSFLWSGSGTISALTHQEIHNAIEPFLHEIGFPTQDFQYALHQLQQGALADPEKKIEFLKAILPRIQGGADPRYALIEASFDFAQFNFVGSWLDLVGEKVGNDKITLKIGFSPSGFSKPFYFYDLDFYGRGYYGALPLVLGLPPFEHFNILSDCRQPKDALWGSSNRFLKSVFQIDGKRMGRLVYFSDWAGENNIDLKDWKLPKSKVLLMERDFVCPIRKRIVLYSGCVYGAPFYVYELGFPMMGKSDLPLTRFYKESEASSQMDAQLESWKRLEKLQSGLMRLVSGRIQIKYEPKPDSILIDGKTIFSGAQARILKKIISAFCKKGQSRFEHSEFKYDSNITANPKRSSFETHLSRIATKLSVVEPSIKIDRIAKGEFHFLPERELEYFD